MISKLQNIYELIQIKKKIISGLSLWTAIISLVLIKTFFLAREHAAVPRPFSWIDAPMFESFDIAVLMAASIVIALILADAKAILYGYVVSISLSCIIGVAYDSFYIWSMWGYLFETVPFGWEHACYWAVINVLRAMFPFGIGVCLLGATIGGALSSHLSRKALEQRHNIRKEERQDA